MAMPRVSTRLPLYDPSKSSLAYGDRAIPKLNRELQSNELSVRQQSLLLLEEVLHKRENLALALKEGIDKSLKELLVDKDEIVRERATKVLSNIAQHALARDSFIHLDMIKALSFLFSDDSYEVRLNAHSAIEMCARTNIGAKGAVEAELIPLCVKKLVDEDKPQLKEIILDTLHWCLIIDPVGGLDCYTIPICVKLLNHSIAKLRGQAARLIFDLTVPLQGKRTACQVPDCTQVLTQLLLDDSSFVRAQSAAALMSIAVITEGKYKELTCQSHLQLMQLMEDTNSEARLNAIKALGLIAETPQGKQELQPALDKLRELVETDSSEMVRKAASTSIRIITWLP